MRSNIVSIVLALCLMLFISGCGAANPVASTVFKSLSEQVEVSQADSVQCPSGGIAVVVYVDTNLNGVRDADEAPRSTNVVCSGTNGQNGQDGQDGRDGRDGLDGDDGNDGQDGQNGRDGQDAYQIVYELSTGAPGCAYGGDTIRFALDVNRNQVLDARDTNQRSIEVCNGSPAPAPSPSPCPPPIASPSPAPVLCRAKVVASSSWSNGYVVDLTVTNLGTAISSWSVDMVLPSGQYVQQVWNASLSAASGKIRATSMSYNGVVAHGATLTFGMKVERNSAAMLLSSTIKLNGAACEARQ